jgi:hypothetical protein
MRTAIKTKSHTAASKQPRAASGQQSVKLIPTVNDPDY